MRAKSLRKFSCHVGTQTGLAVAKAPAAFAAGCWHCLVSGSSPGVAIGDLQFVGMQIQSFSRPTTTGGERLEPPVIPEGSSTFSQGGD
jgi:hypothetical protein